MRDLITKHALHDRLKHGTPKVGAIVGKLIAERPDLKEKARELAGQIQEVLDEIEALSEEEVRRRLEDDHPELLEKRLEERDPYAFLDLPEHARTAFPPGPEKYPHIGHAKAIILNYEAARAKDGVFILRFEDTNPSTVRQEYYDAMLRDFEWLGVKWDELLYASDFLDLIISKAEHLIREGKAYVDTADQEAIKRSRETGEPTPDRSASAEDNLERWRELAKAEAGSAVVRLKIDLKAKNTTLRDPTIFRLLDGEHPRKPGHRLWPTYDFQSAILDSYSNLDMRLRSKEFEIRRELQEWIQRALELKVTKTYEFGRFTLKGAITSGREIREKVESGELMGWDDPSLATLAALRRRGFLPEAIKRFVLGTGISKAEATTTWDELILCNKRLLDASAKRYSAIAEPVEVVIEGTPSKSIELHTDPNEKKGGRPMHLSERVLLSRRDVDAIADGEVFRLMDTLNAKKDADRFVFLSEGFESFPGGKVINFLPVDEAMDVSVLLPDKQTITLKAEKNLRDVEEGEVVQFERFGFVRLDEKASWRFWFTHR